MAVLWANISSLPLFARIFLGDFFQFGYCYTVFDYDVYLGEMLLSLAALALVCLLCTRSRKIPQSLMIGMALAFTLCLAVCVAASAVGRTGGTLLPAPAFLPGRHPLRHTRER